MLDAGKELEKLDREWQARGGHGPWPLAVWSVLIAEARKREPESLAADVAPDPTPADLQTEAMVSGAAYPPLPEGRRHAAGPIDLEGSGGIDPEILRCIQREIGATARDLLPWRNWIYRNPLLSILLFYYDLWNPGQRGSLAARYLEVEHESRVDRIVDQMREWLKARRIEIDRVTQ